MCNKIHYDELAKKMDGFIETGNVAIRKLAASSAGTDAKVDALTKAYEQHHKESREDAKEVWKHIDALNGFKNNWKGIVIGVSLVFSTAWAGVLLVYNYITHTPGG